MRTHVKRRIEHLIFEFIMIFMGVFLAFFVNDWANRRQEKKYAEAIIENLNADVRSDSLRILHAIERVKMQHEALTALIERLADGDFESATEYIYWSYFTYNAFSPTTETFESMVFGGDMKLVRDLEIIKALKELDQINQVLEDVHTKYYSSVESFKFNFVCQYDLDHFDFRSIKNKQEFWNRINFLRSNVGNYLEALYAAQRKYNDYLHMTPTRTQLASNFGL